jgi:hypothetical protein
LKLWSGIYSQRTRGTGKDKSSSSYRTVARRTTGSAHPNTTKVSEYFVATIFHDTHALLLGKTTQLGRIVFDVTDLKEHHINAHKEKGLSTRDLKIRVEMLLQIEIIGRDLKFFVRWPANREGKLLPASRSSFSLAAAFKPGTE